VHDASLTFASDNTPPDRWHHHAGKRVQQYRKNEFCSETTQILAVRIS